MFVNPPLPADTKGIKGYTVTASPGGVTCVANGGLTNKCVFPIAKLGFVNTYTFTVVANAVENGPASAPSLGSGTQAISIEVSLVIFARGI